VSSRRCLVWLVWYNSRYLSHSITHIARAEILLACLRTSFMHIFRPNCNVAHTRGKNNFSSRWLELGLRIPAPRSQWSSPSCSRDTLDSFVTESITELSAEGAHEEYMEYISALSTISIIPGAREDGVNSRSVGLPCCCSRSALTQVRVLCASKRPC
jgi:hypothetical protein